MKRRAALLLVCVFLGASAQAHDRLSSPGQASGEGEIFVYLQPLPIEAERLTFSVEAVSAVSDQGADVQLALSLATVKHPDARRQRLFALGRLPAGGYAGLSIKVQQASLRREGGVASLLVPDSALQVDSPFVVSRGKALVLWLVFKPGDRVAGGVGFSPTFSASIAPRPLLGRTGVVSNSRSNSITVFDKGLRQATAVIPTGRAPSGMALDQRSGRLYVALAGEDELLAIDLASAEVVDRSRLFPGDRPREVTLTPDGRTLLSVNTGSNSIGVFDTAPLTRLERITVGSGPTSLVIDPTGRRAFVFNTLSSSISVVDIPRRTVIGTVATESAPLRGQLGARGDRLLVIHERSPYVTVIDPLQLTVVTRARLRSGIEAIRIDVRRNLVYLGGRDDAMVDFYDPHTLLPVDSMKTRAGVSYLTIDNEDNSLYIVSPDTKSLAIGSLAERKVVSEIDVGEGPYWVAVMGEK